MDVGVEFRALMKSATRKAKVFPIGGHRGELWRGHPGLELHFTQVERFRVQGFQLKCRN